MSRPTQAPTRTPDEVFNGATREEHPAYGAAAVTHWTATPGYRLFGSDLIHGSGVTLAFTEATLSRGLSRDSVFSGRGILEVDFSHSQWASLISSHGGRSLPCTINHRYTEGSRVMPMIALPEATKKELHGEEMATSLREHLKAIQAQIDALGIHLEAGGGKKELRAIHENLKREAAYLPGSVQFVYDQFAEATETVVNQAKSEVDGYVNGVVHGLGLKSLADLPRLTEEKGEESHRIVVNGAMPTMTEKEKSVAAAAKKAGLP
jgi:hypothetical protein